jgi:hypothetical protein
VDSVRRDVFEHAGTLGDVVGRLVKVRQSEADTLPFEGEIERAELLRPSPGRPVGQKSMASRISGQVMQ